MMYEVVLHPDLHSDLKKLSKAQQISVLLGDNTLRDHHQIRLFV